MNDEEVRIPIFLDIEDDDVEAELSNLRPKLNKLKASMDEIFKDRSEKIKLMDTVKIALAERQLANIRDRLQAITEEEKKSASVANMVDRNIELYKEFAKELDILINKYPVLQKAMADAAKTEAKKVEKSDTPEKWKEITNAKELKEYLDELLPKLDSMREYLSTDTKGNSVLEFAHDSIKKNITAIDEYVVKIGEMMKALDAASRKAKDDTQFYMQANKAHKGGEEWATSQVVAQAKVEAQAARKYNSELQNEYGKTTAVIKDNIEERIKALQEEVSHFNVAAKTVDATGKHQDTASKARDEEVALRKLAQAEEEAASGAEHLAESEGKSASASKDSAAQFYYKLRAIKMFGFVINQSYSAVNNFAKKSTSVLKGVISAFAKMITPINTARKALSRLSAEHKKFGANVKATTKAHEGFNLSLKQAILSLLKYGLGIRSLFVLFNKLRHAISSGFEEMAVQFDDVNKNMSSIVTSINMIKASLTAMVEPLIRVIAPALEKISALVSDIAYKVASFIAALTGQTAVYKSIRVQTDYAASLDKTAKSAKEAKKQLSGLDKLNVINSDKDNDSNKDKTPTMGWEKLPIDSKMADLAKKFKDFLKRLFGPIKAAWEKWGAWVKKAWKKALSELLALGKDVARDFWRVWEEPETQKIFENIFHIIGDIGLIVANLARNFREAWNHNENGYRTLKAIRDIILVISEHLVKMADYTVEWSKHLNFTPMMDALADTLEQKVVPAVDKIMGLVETLYEQIFLNILKNFIEGGLPRIITMAGKVIEIIGIIAEKIDFAIKSGSNGINIVNKISDLFSIVADHIDAVLDKTKEWAENLDFRPILIAINNFLERIKPMVDTIASAVEHFWTDVVLPFWKYLIEDGGPRLLDLLGKIFGQYDENTGFGIKWDEVKQQIEDLMPVIEQFLELGWDTFLHILEDIGLKFDEIMNSGAIGDITEKLKKWLEEADPEVLATKIEKFALRIGKLWIELKILSQFIMPVVTGILTAVNAIKQLKLIDSITKLTTTIGGGAAGSGGGGLAAAIGGLALPIAIAVGAIAVIVGAFGGVQETIDAVKKRFDEFAKYIKEFAQKLNLGESFDKLKEKFSDLADSLQMLRPVFEFILDKFTVIAEFLGGEALALIDGLMTSLGGVIDFLSGLMQVIKGLCELITGDWKQGLSDITDGLGKEFQGIIETVTGLFEFLGDSVANLAEQIFPGAGDAILKFVDDTKAAIDQWVQDVIAFFKDLKYNLIGDPIVIDMQEGIVQSFGEWISQTAADVGGWVKDRVADFVELAKGIGEEAIHMKDKVVEKFGEMKDKAGEKADEFKTTAEEKFGAVRQKVEDNLAESKFLEYGKKAITGVERGIKQFGAVLTAANTNINTLKTKFREGLSLNTFRTLGSNLINALSSGLKSGLSSALSAVSSVCSQITNKVRSAFQIHSPSRVFIDIGEMLMKGLVVGVDDGSEEVTDSFEALIPTKSTLEKLYDSYIDIFAKLTSEITMMFDNMFAHIQETMASLERLASMSNASTSLSKIANIAVPEIVVGQTLPSNKEFKSSSSSDDIEKRLPDIIKRAVVEAIEDTIDLRDTDETVIVNIDGKEVFQAVRNENSRYKKQHGASAFA